ncbi:MAG: P1 family peptidase, partial [Spirochaetales bacterium]|nr:P1 family peptidase [Candidatus Physcosoma equi]
SRMEPRDNKFVGNTTIAAIITNAQFSKASLCKIAGMAHDGMARSIRPVHTTVDGDSIFALSTGSVKADQDVVGILAAKVLSKAILKAVTSAEAMYGFPSVSDFS